MIYIFFVPFVKLFQSQVNDPNFSQNKEFAPIVNDLERKLLALDEPLNQKLTNLQHLETSTQHFVELTVEGAWIREKSQQVENLSKTLELDPQKAYQIGQRLMVIHRLERQLKSHILEANNRRPRVKALCKVRLIILCLLSYLIKKVIFFFWKK